ncbi:hypothetical protein, partial [Phytobacter massiliensis]|uniref:hypothetical protein n=1 Tax=Phytobacter massiliensis TaxID=1485952 RepID=UPI0005C6E2F5
ILLEALFPVPEGSQREIADICEHVCETLIDMFFTVLLVRFIISHINIVPDDSFYDFILVGIIYVSLFTLMLFVGLYLVTQGMKSF